MARMLGLLTLSILSCLVAAFPPGWEDDAPINDSVRPLVIWHGMGDSFGSKGMLGIAAEVREMHPGIYVHSVYIKDENKGDQEAGFFGHVDQQIDEVAAQLANVSYLANGYDAVGFSQGGQFLRTLAQRHPHPPMHNLITFGSQHMGVSAIPACNSWNPTCALMKRLARSGVYTEWAQRNIVQAQYFRDPSRMEEYLERSTFLADANNERPAERNGSYAENLSHLENLVLVIFAQDVTVVPKETSWFASEAIPPKDESLYAIEGRQRPMVKDEPVTLIPMREQPLYKEDWIGLRTLDEAGKVHFESCDGPHMHISDECWRPLAEKYFGGVLGS